MTNIVTNADGSITVTVPQSVTWGITIEVPIVVIGIAVVVGLFVMFIVKKRKISSN